MGVKLLVPTALRSFTGGSPEVTVSGNTAGEALRALTEAYPDAAKHLFDDNQNLRSFVNVYIGDTNIKNLDGLETPVTDGQTIMLVPAIAGGTLT